MSAETGSRISRRSLKKPVEITTLPEAALEPEMAGGIGQKLILGVGFLRIPVRVQTAVSDRTPTFNYLHAADNSPVGQKWYCKADGQELDSSELTRGFEYDKGKYVVVTGDDLRQAAAERSQLLMIDGFVPPSKIPFLYFQKPYYLEPENKDASHIYSAFRDTLKKKNRIGIGTYSPRNQPVLVALFAQDDVLVLDQMYNREEIKKAEGINAAADVVPQRELKLMGELIDLYGMDFKPEEYPNTYAINLRRIIEHKLNDLPLPKVPSAPIPTAGVDIMDVLRESVKQARTKKSSSKTPKISGPPANT